MNDQSLHRHFEAARATVVALRKREAILRGKLSALSPATLEWRHARAELLGVDGALSRARSAMAQRRRELERSEAR